MRVEPRTRPVSVQRSTGGSRQTQSGTPTARGPQCVRTPSRVDGAGAAPRHSFDRAAGAASHAPHPSKLPRWDAARGIAAGRNQCGRRPRDQPCGRARAAPRHSFSPDAGHDGHRRGCPPCCRPCRDSSYERRPLEPGPEQVAARGRRLSGPSSCGRDKSGPSGRGERRRSTHQPPTARRGPTRQRRAATERSRPRRRPEADQPPSHPQRPNPGR